MLAHGEQRRGLLLFGENLSLFETDLAEVRPITTRERTPTPY